MNCCFLPEDVNKQEEHVDIMLVCDGCDRYYCSKCVEFADQHNQYEYIEEEDLLHTEECDLC